MMAIVLYDGYTRSPPKNKKPMVYPWYYLKIISIYVSMDIHKWGY